MIQAEIKFITYDSPLGREEVQKAMNNNEFILSLCIAIGTKGDDAIEYFYLQVIHFNYLKKSEYQWGKFIICLYK